MAVILDFVLPFLLYLEHKWGELNIMLGLNDAKTLISAYKFIERTCKAVDEYIYNHAVNYGPDPEFCSTYSVINNIVDLMERKNKLIKLKNIIDDTLEKLSLLDRQILIIKMRFRTNIKNLQAILKIPSERTTFRRIDSALNNFQTKLNQSQYAKDVEEIIESEHWILNIKQSLTSSSTLTTS